MSKLIIETNSLMDYLFEEGALKMPAPSKEQFVEIAQRIMDNLAPFMRTARLRTLGDLLSVRSCDGLSGAQLELRVIGLGGGGGTSEQTTFYLSEHSVLVRIKRDLDRDVYEAGYAPDGQRAKILGEFYDTIWMVRANALHTGSALEPLYVLVNNLELVLYQIEKGSKKARNRARKYRKPLQELQKQLNKTNFGL